MKRTLSVAEVAEELGISKRAVWQRIYRGQLPYRRWGRKVFVLRDELDTFLRGLPGTSSEEAAAKAQE